MLFEGEVDLPRDFDGHPWSDGTESGKGEVNGRVPGEELGFGEVLVTGGEGHENCKHPDMMLRSFRISQY